MLSRLHIILALCCITLAYNAYDARERLADTQASLATHKLYQAQQAIKATCQTIKPIAKPKPIKEAGINLNHIAFAQYLPPLPVKALKQRKD